MGGVGRREGGIGRGIDDARRGKEAVHRTKFLKWEEWMRLRTDG